MGIGFKDPAGGDLVLKKISAKTAGLFMPFAEDGQFLGPGKIFRLVFLKGSSRDLF